MASITQPLVRASFFFPAELSRAALDHDKNHRTIINNAWNDKYRRGEGRGGGGIPRDGIAAAGALAVAECAINHSNRIKYKIRCHDGTTSRAGCGCTGDRLCAVPGRFIYLHGHASSAELTYFLHANPATGMTTTTTTTMGRSSTWAFIIAGQGLNGGFARDPRQHCQSPLFLVYLSFIYQSFLEQLWRRGREQREMVSAVKNYLAFVECVSTSCDDPAGWTFHHVTPTKENKYLNLSLLKYRAIIWTSICLFWY